MQQAQVGVHSGADLPRAPTRVRRRREVSRQHSHAVDPLVRTEDGVYCVQDVCTHEQAFLSEGFCEGFEIECPLHGSIFDVRTGEVKSLPATEALKTYPVKLEGEDVLVDVEA